MLLAPSLEREGGSRLPRDMADDDLVNALSQYLELEPVEKQALLERAGVLARCRTLVELIEMKLLHAAAARQRPAALSASG